MLQQDIVQTLNVALRVVSAETARPLIYRVAFKTGNKLLNQSRYTFFVELAVIGALLAASSLKRRQKPKIPTGAVVGGAVAAATIFALLQGVLKEVEQRQARERALAAAKLAELEQQYHMYKDRLTPEQRQFFEQKIAEYKRRLGGA